MGEKKAKIGIGLGTHTHSYTPHTHTCTHTYDTHKHTTHTYNTDTTLTIHTHTHTHMHTHTNHKHTCMAPIMGTPSVTYGIKNEVLGMKLILSLHSSLHPVLLTHQFQELDHGQCTCNQSSKCQSFVHNSMSISYFFLF